MRKCIHLCAYPSYINEISQRANSSVICNALVFETAISDRLKLSDGFVNVQFLLTMITQFMVTDVIIVIYVHISLAYNNTTKGR